MTNLTLNNLKPIQTISFLKGSYRTIQKKTYTLNKITVTNSTLKMSMLIITHLLQLLASKGRAGLLKSHKWKTTLINNSWQSVQAKLMRKLKKNIQKLKMIPRRETEKLTSLIWVKVQLLGPKRKWVLAGDLPIMMPLIHYNKEAWRAKLATGRLVVTQIYTKLQVTMYELSAVVTQRTSSRSHSLKIGWIETWTKEKRDGAINKVMVLSQDTVLEAAKRLVFKTRKRARPHQHNTLVTKPKAWALWATQVKSEVALKHHLVSTTRRF